MVQRLARQGLVVRARFAALRLVRRHRILEAYLIPVLGYTWDRVHKEADRLEHSGSDAPIDRMATLIGEPTVEPHGAPIPAAGGKVARPAKRALYDLAVGERGPDCPRRRRGCGLLRYLTSLRLLRGAIVQLVGREPFDLALPGARGARGWG